MQKYSGQQWCRDISESGPTVARQWPDSARQGPTPRQSGLKDTGPAVRHVRHPRHLRHARHSDTRHSDTLRHDPRVSLSNHPQTPVRHRPDTSDTVDTSVNRHRSDTAPTLLRHLRHLRHSDTSGLKRGRGGGEVEMRLRRATAACEGWPPMEGGAHGAGPVLLRPRTKKALSGSVMGNYGRRGGVNKGLECVIAFAIVLVQSPSHNTKLECFHLYQ